MPKDTTKNAAGGPDADRQDVSTLEAGREPDQAPGADTNDAAATGADDPAAEGAEGREPGVDEQLQGAREEAAQSYDRYLRTQAELQNVLKRHEREKSDRVKYAAEALGRDLVAVVDDLERALEHVGEADEGLAKGVRMVRDGLLAALQRHGIERVEAAGKVFDPSEHEAVTTVESGEHEPGTVVDEHRSGYRIHDRLLRAAMVAVSKAPADKDGE